jgi:hypothetical protein
MNNQTKVNPYFCLVLDGRKALGGAELVDDQTKVKTYFCLFWTGEKRSAEPSFFSERKPDSDHRSPRGTWVAGFVQPVRS